MGAHFGVVLVREDGAQVEVATFRSDLEYRDGRHPDGVHFETDPRQDVLRRDFTINALLLDPLTRRGSGFRRWPGGSGCEADSRDRRSGAAVPRRSSAAASGCAFCGAARIRDRAGTFAAIRRLAPMIQSVSAERVRDEIARILTEGGARRGFELLDSTGLLQEVLPGVAALKGVEQPPEFHPEGDVWTHTLMMLDGLQRAVANTGAGGAAARYRQARDVPCRRADPLRRPRGEGHRDRAALLTRLRFPNHVIEGAKR